MDMGYSVNLVALSVSTKIRIQLTVDSCCSKSVMLILDVRSHTKTSTPAAHVCISLQAREDKITAYLIPALR